MKPEIDVINRQRAVTVDPESVADQVRYFLTRAGADLDAWEAVTVMYVRDRAIAQANRAYLNHTGPTDVITFTYPPPPGLSGSRGDILINVDAARRESGDRDIPVEHELALYLAHGCDHLTGADDNTPERKTAMLERELKWVQESPFTR